MKLSKKQPILKWMKENVKAKRHGNCFFYAATMSLLFQLKLMKGKPPHKGKGKHKEDTAHFWTEDKKHNIYDPTASQLEKDYDYKGKTVDAKKNIDYVIKDKLFKKLPEEDQETIKEITPKLSKRGEEKKEYDVRREQHAKEILEKFFPFLPIEYFGGWHLRGHHVRPDKSQNRRWTEANFVAELPIPNIAYAPKLEMYCYYPTGIKGKHTELKLSWDASLGDFNTGLIGDPIELVAEDHEINKVMPKILNIIEQLGVESESQSLLRERGVTEYSPKPIGSVQDINFTIIFPNTLFRNFVLESHMPGYIRAEVPPITDEPFEAYYYVSIRLTRGGIEFGISLPKEILDPKLFAALGYHRGQAVVNTMEKFNRLIEPVKNTLDKANAWLDEIKEERGEGEEELELIGNQSFHISKRAATLQERMQARQEVLPEPTPVRFKERLNFPPGYKVYKLGDEFLVQGLLYDGAISPEELENTRKEIQQREEIFRGMLWKDPARPGVVRAPGMDISFQGGRIKVKLWPMPRELGSYAQDFRDFMQSQDGEEAEAERLARIKEVLSVLMPPLAAEKMKRPSERGLLNWSQILKIKGKAKFPAYADTKTMQDDLRPYLSRMLPTNLAVKSLRKENEITLKTYDRTIKGVEQDEPRFALWAHVLNKKVDNLEQFIKNFMNIDGEISVSEVQDQHFLMRPYYLAFLLKGTPTQVYLEDVGTRVDDWTGRRIQAKGVPKGVNRTEAFLIPNQSEFYAVVTDTKKHREQAEQLGYKVFSPDDFNTNPYAQVSSILKQLSEPWDTPINTGDEIYLLTAKKETEGRDIFLTPDIAKWMRDNDGQIPGGGQMSSEERWENNFWDKNGGIMVVFPHPPSQPPRGENVNIKRISGPPRIQEYPFPVELAKRQKKISEPRLRRLVARRGQPIIIDRKRNKIRTTREGFRFLKELLLSPPEPLKRYNKQLFHISKRAALDLREYFPLSTFGSMTAQKTPWAINKYDPNFIRVYLNLGTEQIVFTARIKDYGSPRFSVQLGPTLKDRKTWWNISEETFKKSLPEIHTAIAEYTLERENSPQQQDKMARDFPADLFKGWSLLRFDPKDQIVAVINEVDVYLDITIDKEGRYDVLFQRTAPKDTLFYDVIETPEELKYVQDKIRELGKEGQAIQLEENQSFHISKRANYDLTKLFPPHLFGGFEESMRWRFNKYDENGIVALLKTNNGTVRFQVYHWAERRPGYINIGIAAPETMPVNLLYFLDEESTDGNSIFSGTLTPSHMEMYIGRLKEFIIETSLRAEKEDSSNIMNELFPAKLFAGWKILSYREESRQLSAGQKFNFLQRSIILFKIYFNDRIGFSLKYSKEQPYFKKFDNIRNKIDGESFTREELAPLLPEIYSFIEEAGHHEEQLKEVLPQPLVGNQSFPISKRAQVDLRKYFPAHVFGAMEGDKPQWFITKHKPNEIEAYLRFHQGEVFLRVDKEQDKISWAVGWPEEVHPSGKEGVEVRWGFTNEYKGAEVENLSKGEFEEQLPQIHDLIAEFTLKKEKAEDPTPLKMKEVFPPEIFKGWDTLKYEDTVIDAGCSKLGIYLRIMLIHHEGKPLSYNIFFELFNQDETSQYNIPVNGNFTQPIQVIKNIGAKAQAIKLESQTFSISKRAIKEHGEPKEILEKFFPELKISTFGGWDALEGREYEKTGRKGELYGAHFMAWASFPKQNNFSNGYFSIDATKDQLPSGHLSWPSQLGDFNLNLKVDIDRNTYTLTFDFPKDVEKIAPIIATIGGFAESMNLAGQRGDSTTDVVPIGKPYNPNLTELFPKEMFSGWDVKEYRNSDIRANTGIKVVFGAHSRGREKEVFIIYQESIEIPAPLKQYAKQNIYIGFPQTQINIETHDLNELKALAPAIRILIEMINEDMTKPTEEYIEE